MLAGLRQPAKDIEFLRFNRRISVMSRRFTRGGRANNERSCGVSRRGAPLALQHGFQEMPGMGV